MGRLANYFIATSENLKTFARIKGHHDLNVHDLVTINKDIAEYTSIVHVNGMIIFKEVIYGMMLPIFRCFLFINIYYLVKFCYNILQLLEILRRICMKKTIRDYDLRSKRVIIRCDFNVPLKQGVIQDDTRIIASLDTIKYAIQEKAKVILLSHLGKVKEEADLVKNDLYPISVRLGELLGQKIFFSPKTRGSELEKMVQDLQDGEVLLIQNTRYEDLDGKKESACNEELAQYWANLGDIFINDAYGTSHRSHASNVGISRHLPNGIGFLVEREIIKLDAIMKEDTHPFVVVMGGAKVHDKISVIENLILKCDKLLIGGGMAYTFLKVKGYDVGRSLVDLESVDFCQRILEQYADKIVLPVDHIVSISFESEECMEKNIQDTLEQDMGFDIGKGTIQLFCQELSDAKRVIMNGPMGCFEKPNYAKGTQAIYDYLVKHSIKTLIGGGDSAASVSQLSDPNQFYHISTGGGATLEYLEGKILPGIGVIDEERKI